MQVMKSLSLAMLAAVVLALACFASAADTPLPDYSISSGVNWLGNWRQYHIEALDNALTSLPPFNHPTPEGKYFIEKAEWILIYVLITILIWIVLTLGIIALISTQCCCACQSDPKKLYDTFHKTVVRILLLVLAAGLLFLAAFTLYYNVVLFKSLGETIVHISGPARDAYSHSNSIISTVSPIAPKYNIDIPESITYFNRFLSSVSMNIFGDDDGEVELARVTSYFAAGGSAPFVFLALFVIAMLLFTFFGWRGWAVIALVLGFIFLALSLAFTIPYSAGAYFVSHECATNIRDDISVVAEINISQGGNDTQCSVNLFEYYLFCDPMPANSSCPTAGSFDDDLARAIAQLNATIPITTNSTQKAEMEADRAVLVAARVDLVLFLTCDSISGPYASAEATFCKKLASAASMSYLGSLGTWPLFFLAILGILLGFNRIGGKKAFGPQHELNEYRTLEETITYGHTQTGARRAGLVVAFIFGIVVFIVVGLAIVASVTLGAGEVVIHHQPAL